MIDFADVKVKVSSEGKGHAIVEIEPLPKGYGYTLGNALRRTLLSSIEGAAVTSIKISGIQHEYSVVKGMMEDVLAFIFNLRGISFVMHTEEPQILKLSVKGKKDVTAADIKLTSDVEIANPDFVIAHLTDSKATLDVEMIVEKGSGFEYSKEEKRAEAGLIPVDANFSPVNKVGYKVSDVRVGQKTDLDKITFELELKENVNAKDVMVEACKHIADGYVRMIKSLKEDYLDEDIIYSEYEPEVKETEKEENVDQHKNGNNGVDVKAVKIEELNVSGRVVKALKSKGIQTVDELLDHTETDVRSLKGMGNASMRELKEALKKLGVSLKPEE